MQSSPKVSVSITDDWPPQPTNMEGIFVSLSLSPSLSSWWLYAHRTRKRYEKSVDKPFGYVTLCWPKRLDNSLLRLSEILALLIGNGLNWLQITSGCAIYGGKDFIGGGGLPPHGTAESRWRKNVYNKQKRLLVSAQKILIYSAIRMEI